MNNYNPSERKKHRRLIGFQETLDILRRDHPSGSSHNRCSTSMFSLADIEDDPKFPEKYLRVST